MVRGFKGLVFDFCWREFFQRAPFHLQIRLHIKMRCHWTFMAKPQGNDLWCDAGLEQMHGSGVSKSVSGDSAARQRRSAADGLAKTPFQLPRNSGASERLAIAIGQKWGIRLHFIFFNPAAKLLLRLRPKRHDADFPSFAMKLD